MCLAPSWDSVPACELGGFAGGIYVWGDGVSLTALPADANAG
jgi:hypothetical protein